MWYLLLTCFSFLIFIIYNTAAIIQFGFPWSMSKTYYLYEEKKKGLGWLFTIFMWVMGFSIAPGWFEVSNTMGPWMNYFTFLCFFTIAGILFVGTAPRYRDDFEGVIHTVSALICAGSALLWDFLVCWNIWWVPICGMIIPALIATFTKTWKTSRDFWLEMMAFDATFATIITENIVQLVK